MKSKIQKFKTPDNVSLTSVLFEPDTNTNKVAIFLHGNGNNDIFDYYQDTEDIAEIFVNAGISYFAFNNRGSRYINKFKYVDDQGVKQTIWGGMAYEIISDCVYDIDGAISFLKQSNYSEFYIIGGSTGANKAVLYEYLKPNNEVSKYILSAGGDDTGIYYEMLGKDKFNELLKLSQTKISEGKAMDVIWDLGAPFSYRSLYDTLNPDGDYNVFSYYEAQNERLGNKELFREIRSIKKPTLVLYGENDEYCKPNATTCVSVLKSTLKDYSNFEYMVLPGRDHSLNKNTSNIKEVAELEVSFLVP